MMGEQSERAIESCQAGLSDGVDLLQTIIALRNQLNIGCPSADLEQVALECNKVFSLLKSHLEAQNFFVASEYSAGKEIFSKQIQVLEEVIKENNQLIVRLAEEMENTRIQLNHCQRARIAVKQYRARRINEARFIDQKR